MSRYNFSLFTTSPFNLYTLQESHTEPFTPPCITSPLEYPDFFLYSVLYEIVLTFEVSIEMSYSVSLLNPYIETVASPFATLDSIFIGYSLLFLYNLYLGFYQLAFFPYHFYPLSPVLKKARHEAGSFFVTRQNSLDLFL